MKTLLLLAVLATAIPASAQPQANPPLRKITIIDHTPPRAVFIWRIAQWLFFPVLP